MKVVGWVRRVYAVTQQDQAGNVMQLGYAMRPLTQPAL